MRADLLCILCGISLRVQRLKAFDRRVRGGEGARRENRFGRGSRVSVVGHEAVSDGGSPRSLRKRGGKIRTKVVSDRNKETLHGLVKTHVETGAAVYTDELHGYWGLNEHYAHQIIDHAEKYVDGRVHTNGLENFWSLLKRGLHGTYVAVEPFHLFRYLDEQMFRFNNRKDIDDAGRFEMVVSQLVGKRRLTFAELTGKTGAATVH